jgi:hypothetical protein
MSSDLPGVNPATLNGMLLYYRLMTKSSGLGDSTELSRVGLSHMAARVASTAWVCLHRHPSSPPLQCARIYFCTVLAHLNARWPWPPKEIRDRMVEERGKICVG